MTCNIRVTALPAMLIGASLLAGCSAQTRLILNNLMGEGFPTPAATELNSTTESTASSLASLGVNFSSVSTPEEHLNILLPELIKSAMVENNELTVKGEPIIAGWYSDRSGPFYYQQVTGDFMVETTVRAVKSEDGISRPEGSFNSAGLLVRDASSQSGNMRWLMYNIGQQHDFYGTEAKSTIPALDGWHMHKLAGFKSASTFWLTPAPKGVNQARLRLCRVDDEFRFYKKYPGADQWQEESYQADTKVMGNGVEHSTNGVTEGGSIRFIRPDMPSTVQVGLIVNPGMPPNDGEGRFKNLSFTRLNNFDQCRG